ncbi:TPA: cobalt ECF transporter T component CbiQ [Candidatus Woesearchaeota archaeon]|nr:cobalt ECF transporter T component CbiQ [Candidatus Woesearchaeota archaeon]
MEKLTLDQLTYSSRFLSWPPLGKLLLALALLFGSLFADSIIVPLLVLMIGMILLYSSNRFNFPRVIIWAYLNTLLALFIGVFIITLITPGTVIWQMRLSIITLSLSKEGISLASLVFIRAIAGFAVLMFFASSTPLPHLFIALQQLKVPKHVSELTILVYRYFFLFIEQLGSMIQAAECRLGFRDIKAKFRTYGVIVASVFGRSMDFAERAEQALYCRNFRGEFPVYRKPAKLTARWIIIPCIIFAALIVINLKAGKFLTI